MLNTNFPPWPSFTNEESTAIAEVLLSNRVNYWTGNECRQFEAEFAEWAGTSHAIALNNGTVALETALRALGIGRGDEVIVTPRTFIASVSCVISAGATPVFADVDRETQNITAETIAPIVTPRTRAIIPVHLAGMPCDMDPIIDLSRANDIAVIEDCAQAHGAKYKQRPVGSIGDIGAWSFCQDKIITTGGEGGMVTTQDRNFWDRMWSYKDHGKSWNALQNGNGHDGYKWVHESFGTNGRMLEIQARIGRIQLGRIGDWSAARRRNAETIWSAAANIDGVRVGAVPAWAEHAAYKAYIFVESGTLKADWNRDRIMAEINALGVPCTSGSSPEVYLEKAFERSGLRPAARLPVAQELGETSLMFLVHPTLEPEHMTRTCGVLETVMKAAIK